MSVRFGQNGWTLVERTLSSSDLDPGAIEAIPRGLLQSKVVVTRAYRAWLDMPQQTPRELLLREDVGPEEACLLAIRYPSGALTFHTSAERARTLQSDAGTASAEQAVFRIPVRRMGDPGAERGSAPAELTLFVLRFARPATGGGANVDLPDLAARWEEAAWRDKHFEEGWFQVSLGGTYGLTLAPRMPQPGLRTLLLLHGVLSNGSATFGPLAGTDFFDRVRELYGERIYAFNFHSISNTPEESARRLLEELPAGDYMFDAITHSSGGLVLRSVVEQHERDGTSKGRFHLGQSVLVACPNEGMPLAAPARWPQMISWLANLLEVFPVNPFLIGWDFVSEALSWLAASLGNDLPGLRALDPAGQTVASFQSSPLAAPYSALVSNYLPDAALWRRAQDVGIDDLFASASDLLMPSEGGWRIRRYGGVQLAAGRIGCFGPGGNLGSDGDAVHHLDYFGRSETAAFLAAALAGVGHELSPVDANAPLPGRRFERNGVGSPTPHPSSDAPRPMIARRAPAGTGALTEVMARSFSELDDSETFHLLILRAADPKAQNEDKEEHDTPLKHAYVLASYGGATVMETMRLRGDKGEPTTFGKIIGFHRQIKDYTNHAKGTLPSHSDLMAFGRVLFETLFQGDVRRLYDEARSRQRGTKLELVLTSTIPWIDEKPWELCYDASRASYLATEEIHFVRNVLSAVPADSIPPGDGRLRILIASAQAVNNERLSARQEEEDIRRGFQPLIDAGLVSIEILPHATPATIHRRLEMGQFDVVHFIGHGHFDEREGEGYLVFEDALGRELLLRPQSVREIFCGRGLRLVFLNSCQSGAGSRFVDFNLGLAQTLVAHGLPALVANQFAVLDASATSFARYFYASLAQGNTLGHAAREARIAVSYSLHGEPIDWAVPVLYTRNAKLALCQRRRLDVDLSFIDAFHCGARSAGSRRKRIAVWDIDSSFPALEETLRRINDAQTAYGFEVIDLSIPPDSGDLSAGAATLDPEQVTSSLRKTVVTLGFGLLCCVTRQVLSNQRRGWWPNGRKPAMAIISCAGLEFSADGPLADRILTNLLTSLLAGFFGGAGAHAKGAKTCPFNVDADRDPKSLADRSRIDIHCMRTLEKSIPRDLPALEALTKLF